MSAPPEESAIRQRSLRKVDKGFKHTYSRKENRYGFNCKLKISVEIEGLMLSLVLCFQSEIKKRGTFPLSSHFERSLIPPGDQDSAADLQTVSCVVYVSTVDLPRAKLQEEQ